MNRTFCALSLILSGAMLVPASLNSHAAPATWSIAAKPVLVVGQAAGSPGEEFYRVTAGVRTRDGSLVVANAGTGTLSVFSATGQLLQVFGRKGSGPGEFQYIDGVDAWGDTIWVWDPPLRRVTLWRLDGSRVGDYGMPTFEQQSATFVGRFASGEWLLVSATRRSRKGGQEDEFATLLHYASATRRVDRIADVFWRQTYLYHQPNGFSGYRMPFAPKALARPYGEDVIYADSKSATVQLFDQTGSVRQRFVAPVRSRPRQREYIQAYADSLLRVARGSERERIRNVFAALPGAAPAPAFRALLVSPGGYIWLEEVPALRSRTARWFVFDRALRLAAVIDVPARLHLLSVGDDEVVARIIDEDDIERVAVHRIVKR